jgi:poly(hydroxyalkanoate) granule-associated protein
MLKKAKAAAEAEKQGKAAPDSQGKDVADAVLESSRQIWLAGLGAFSRARGEGVKVFEALVQQGQSLESRTRQAAADTALAARDAAQSKAKEMQAKAGGTWDKLEQVFENRVARALSRLGVHTQADVERLAERVDALSGAVNELIKVTGVKARPVRSSPVKRAVKGAVKGAVGSAARSATSTPGSSARNAGSAAPRDGGAASSAPRTGRKTARNASKAAKATAK